VQLAVSSYVGFDILRQHWQRIVACKMDGDAKRGLPEIKIMH